MCAAVCALGSDERAGAFLGISAISVGRHVRRVMDIKHAVSRAQLCLMLHDAIVVHVAVPE